MVCHVILSHGMSCDLSYMVIPADSGAIPLEFTSHLPQNFDIPVISPEQSPKLTGTEWHWNPVTRMNTANFVISDEKKILKKSVKK